MKSCIVTFYSILKETFTIQETEKYYNMLEFSTLNFFLEDKHI